MKWFAQPHMDLVGHLAGRRRASRTGSRFAINAARPPNFDRPWSAAPPPQRARPDSATDSSADGTNSAQSPPRDATPRPEDIEADE